MVSFSLFKVLGRFSFNPDQFQLNLSQNRFIDLSQKSDIETESCGWVSPENCLMDPVVDEIFYDSYLCLSMRLDCRTISKTLLADKCALEEKKKLAELGRERLSKKERQEIREKIREELMKNSPIKSLIFRALWNYESQNCFLFATSSAAQHRFSQLFEKTFGLELELETPSSLAIAWAKSHNAIPVLSPLEPSSFVPPIRKAE